MHLLSLPYWLLFLIYKSVCPSVFMQTAHLPPRPNHVCASHPGTLWEWLGNQVWPLTQTSWSVNLPPAPPFFKMWFWLIFLWPEEGIAKQSFRHKVEEIKVKEQAEPWISQRCFRWTSYGTAKTGDENGTDTPGETDDRAEAAGSRSCLWSWVVRFLATCTFPRSTNPLPLIWVSLFSFTKTISSIPSLPGLDFLGSLTCHNNPPHLLDLTVFLGLQQQSGYILLCTKLTKKTPSHIYGCF